MASTLDEERGEQRDTPRGKQPILLELLQRDGQRGGRPLLGERREREVLLARLREAEAAVLDVEDGVVGPEEGVAEDEQRAKRRLEVQRQEEQLTLVAHSCGSAADVVLRRDL